MSWVQPPTAPSEAAPPSSGTNITMTLQEVPDEPYCQWWCGCLERTPFGNSPDDHSSDEDQGQFQLRNLSPSFDPSESSNLKGPYSSRLSDICTVRSFRRPKRLRRWIMHVPSDKQVVVVLGLQDAVSGGFLNMTGKAFEAVKLVIAVCDSLTNDETSSLVDTSTLISETSGSLPPPRSHFRQSGTDRMSSTGSLILGSREGAVLPRDSAFQSRDSAFHTRDSAFRGATSAGGSTRDVSFSRTSSTLGAGSQPGWGSGPGASGGSGPASGPVGNSRKSLQEASAPFVPIGLNMASNVVLVETIEMARSVIVLYSHRARRDRDLVAAPDASAVRPPIPPESEPLHPPKSERHFAESEHHFPGVPNAAFRGFRNVL